MLQMQGRGQSLGFRSAIGSIRCFFGPHFVTSNKVEAVSSAARLVGFDISTFVGAKGKIGWNQER